MLLVKTFIVKSMRDICKTWSAQGGRAASDRDPFDLCHSFYVVIMETK